MASLKVAVVGLQFGGSFLPALHGHPDVGAVGLCDVNQAKMEEAARTYRTPESRVHRGLEEVLAADYDAVLLFTPIPDHAGHTLAALAAGKHVACAVPMADRLEDLERIVAARRAAGKVYMMMETSLYSPEFLHVQDLHAEGAFGRLQYMHGVWQVRLENHPKYWMGLPPMHYITHPLSPILKLAGCRARKVTCMGSGSMGADLQAVYGNPYPVEAALFDLVPLDGAANAHPLVAQITSMTFDTAFEYKETFDVFGSRQSFRWATFHDDKHALLRAGTPSPTGAKYPPTTLYRFAAPDADDRLPEPLRRQNRRMAQGHLVHEFVSAIVAGRGSAIDAAEAARYTAPGLCAHRSAMSGGAPVEIPDLA